MIVCWRREGAGGDGCLLLLKLMMETLWPPQPSRSHRYPVAPSSKVPLLLAAIVSGAESLLLTSSFSESFSDSAELDSSSDSSPFPNNNNDGWMDGWGLYRGCRRVKKAVVDLISALWDGNWDRLWG